MTELPSVLSQRRSSRLTFRLSSSQRLLYNSWGLSELRILFFISFSFGLYLFLLCFLETESHYIVLAILTVLELTI